VQVLVVATVMLLHRRRAPQRLLTVVQKLLTKELLRPALKTCRVSMYANSDVNCADGHTNSCSYVSCT
jgi:hypothetical protein